MEYWQQKGKKVKKKKNKTEIYHEGKKSQNPKPSYVMLNVRVYDS